MADLATTHLNDLQLDLKLASLFGELNRLKAQTDELALTQPQLLIAMGMRAQTNLSKLLPGPLDYNHALTQLPPTSEVTPESICAIHQAMHEKGGQLRSMKINHPGVMAKPNPSEIARLLEQSCKGYRQGCDAQIDTLILVPLLLRDILLIFPFMDGNKRLLMLLYKWLLAEQHPMLHYRDFEKRIIATEAAMFRAFDQSVESWLRYWWLLMRSLYQTYLNDLNRASSSGKKLHKGKVVRQYILQNLPCSSQQVQQALPQISKDMIRVVLRELRDEQKIKAFGRGRGAKWISA